MSGDKALPDHTSQIHNHEVLRPLLYQKHYSSTCSLHVWENRIKPYRGALNNNITFMANILEQILFLYELFVADSKAAGAFSMIW